MAFVREERPRKSREKGVFCEGIRFPEGRFVTTEAERTRDTKRMEKFVVPPEAPRNDDVRRDEGPEFPVGYDVELAGPFSRAATVPHPAAVTVRSRCVRRRGRVSVVIL